MDFLNLFVNLETDVKEFKSAENQIENSDSIFRIEL